MKKMSPPTRLERPDSGAKSGRQRSEPSRLALLNTAFAMLKKHSLVAISTQEIAAKAGVSTATLYRWWPTKEALLLDAFLHVKAQKMVVKEDGTPLENLREHMLAGAKFLAGSNGLAAARLLAAIQDDVWLREAFAEKFDLPNSCKLVGFAEAAVEAGELPHGTDVRLFVDSLFGPIMVRMMVRHQPMSCVEAGIAFDLMVAGVRGLWGRDRG